MVESHRDERRQVDGTLGLETQHFERARSGFRGDNVGRRRECLIDRGSWPWPGAGIWRTVEVDLIGFLRFEVRKSVEQLADTSGAQWITLHRGFSYDSFGVLTRRVVEADNDLGVAGLATRSVDAHGHSLGCGFVSGSAAAVASW